MFIQPISYSCLCNEWLFVGIILIRGTPSYRWFLRQPYYLMPSNLQNLTIFVDVMHIGLFGVGE
jgi:hypothetical protein